MSNAWDGVSYSQILSSTTKDSHHYLSYSRPNTASWTYLSDRLFFPWEGFHTPEEICPTLCQSFYAVMRKLQAPSMEKLVLGHCVNYKKVNFWLKHLKKALFLAWPPCSSQPVSLYHGNWGYIIVLCLYFLFFSFFFLCCNSWGLLKCFELWSKKPCYNCMLES